MTKVVKYKKGMELDANSVYIGRAFGPFKESSKWANPFIIGRNGATKEEVIAKYEAYLGIKPELFFAIPELKDKTLICWCSPEPCHGDVLVKLLNIVDFWELI